MTIKQKTKKTIYKKAVKREKIKTSTRQKKHYAAAFAVGVTFLVILAILLFRYAASNNYREILGEKTYIEHQLPKN